MMNTFLILAAVYGTLGAQTNFVKAPPTVAIDGHVRVTKRVTEAEANALGYKLLVDEPPTCASNEYAVAVGYRVDTDEAGAQRIRRTYRIETIAPAPRKFSKLKIYGAITQIGAWDAVEAWLRGKTLNGVNGWMAFQLAQEVSEDHPLFSPLADEARQLLGLSQAQFDALLSACVLED